MNDNIVKYLQTLKARLEIRQRHMVATGQVGALVNKDVPLEGREQQVFDRITKQIRQKAEVEASAEQTEGLLQQIMTEHGARNFVDVFIGEVTVMGVPYQYFVINALICLPLFIATQNFSLLLVVAPGAHLAFFLYYLKNRARMRDQKITKILMEGIQL